MKISQIGGVEITRSKPFLILEAGVNHEGSLGTAFEMVDAGAEAGADAIKFQSYKAETLASKNSPAYWDQTKEPTTSQYELFKKHDTFGDQEYAKLSQRCKEKGILFCSTPFDSHFVDFLEPLMDFYKIASADITNFPMIRQIASKKKPILLSTGASYLQEIHEAVKLIRDEGVDRIALMHCVLEYPAPSEHANLNLILDLQSNFPDCTIGYSDHVAPEYNCSSLLTAWLMGADILEKHYTLDKTLEGNDHYHAMDPDDIRNFISQQQYMQGMLGIKDKTVLPGEENSRKYARRSLVATCDIPAGTIIAPDMLIPKRPGTGISPLHYDEIIGKTTTIDIKEDDLLQWDMI